MRARPRPLRPTPGITGLHEDHQSAAAGVIMMAERWISS